MAGDGKRNFPLELEIGAKTDLIEFFKLKCEKIAILFAENKANFVTIKGKRIKKSALKRERGRESNANCFADRVSRRCAALWTLRPNAPVNE